VSHYFLLSKHSIGPCPPNTRLNPNFKSSPGVVGPAVYLPPIYFTPHADPSVPPLNFTQAPSPPFFYPSLTDFPKVFWRTTMLTMTIVLHNPPACMSPAPGVHSSFFRLQTSPNVGRVPLFGRYVLPAPMEDCNRAGRKLLTNGLPPPH